MKYTCFSQNWLFWKNGYVVIRFTTYWKYNQLFFTYIHVDIWSSGWYWVDCYLEVISDFIETISLSLKNSFISNSTPSIEKSSLSEVYPKYRFLLECTLKRL